MEKSVLPENQSGAVFGRGGDYTMLSSPLAAFIFLVLCQILIGGQWFTSRPYIGHQKDNKPGRNCDGATGFIMKKGGYVNIFTFEKKRRVIVYFHTPNQDSRAIIAKCAAAVFNCKVS